MNKDLARSSELDGPSGIFSTHPTLNGIPAGLPSPLPFGSAPVRLMDQPINGLLGGADNYAHAAVSKHQRFLPSMYHHDRTPDRGGVNKPSRAAPHHSNSGKRNGSREMNEFAGFTKPVIGGHWAMLRFARDGHPKPIMEGGEKPKVFPTEIEALGRSIAIC